MKDFNAAICPFEKGDMLSSSDKAATSDGSNHTAATIAN